VFIYVQRESLKSIREHTYRVTDVHDKIRDELGILQDFLEVIGAKHAKGEIFFSAFDASTLIQLHSVITMYSYHVQ
jgi:hypothetical protein